MITEITRIEIPIINKKIGELTPAKIVSKMKNKALSVIHEKSPEIVKKRIKVKAEMFDLDLSKLKLVKEPDEGYTLFIRGD